jgi:hypothetical protein
MDPRKLTEPVATPTEQEQEAVVGGASTNRPRPTLEAPPNQTQRAYRRHWDPHPPVLGLVEGVF